MSRMIFVTGSQGSGKSTFIHREYADGDLYYIFDLDREGRKMFEKWGRDNDDHLMHIYNELCAEAMDYLVGDKTVVVEFSLGTRHDPEIKQLIEGVKLLGIHTELVFLDCKVEECAIRLRKAQEDPLYCSSLDLTENILEVLKGVVDSYRMSREMGYLE